MKRNNVVYLLFTVAIICCFVLDIVRTREKNEKFKEEIRVTDSLIRATDSLTNKIRLSLIENDSIIDYIKKAYLKDTIWVDPPLYIDSTK